MSACRSFSSLVLAVGLAFSGPARANGLDQELCIADWSEAAPIVLRENLSTARDVQELARRRLDGDLVRITLCQDGPRFVYRIVMRDTRGRISSQTIDARRPFAP